MMHCLRVVHCIVSIWVMFCLIGCSGTAHDAALGTGPEIEAAGTVFLPEQQTADRLQHFVEFRAVMPIFPGHSYLVHGLVAHDGSTVKQSSPLGFYPVLGLIGGGTMGWLAIPGTVDPDPSDAENPPVETYRVRLTPPQYAKLLVFLKSWQHKPGMWNLVFNNCNDFAAGAARAVGLKAPEGLGVIPPFLYVRKMRQLNQS